MYYTAQLKIPESNINFPKIKASPQEVSLPIYKNI